MLTDTFNEIFTSDTFVKAVFGNRRKKSQEISKAVIRPVTIKGDDMFQCEYHYENKVTHENIPQDDISYFAASLIGSLFKQADIFMTDENITILASKPENPRIKHTKAENIKQGDNHNRKKEYIIPEGEPVDFLIRLGVMTKDGQVVHKHYSKFRQINRFLEIVDDSFNSLPKDGVLKVIDFGCGKSYLTFALYYYLVNVKGREAEITGLDLKADVISSCRTISQDLGYSGLNFEVGDIADYTSDDIDMVVTLHACDTASDYALINAVNWKSKVILSVPCCQHELFRQIDSETLSPLLRHGLLKDKFTELLTDELRVLKLEEKGYDVSVLEFTSLEHTSKNVMIKAVKGVPYKKKQLKAASDYKKLKEEFNVNPTIDSL